jgi:thioredoxin-like negative regulator of GroEL
MPQLWALATAAAMLACLLAASGLRSHWVSRRSLAAGAHTATGEPYVLYFWSQGCTVCRTHQEPALEGLAGVRVEKVDALAEPEVAGRFHVYTVPTTVVVGRDGRARKVNYGYAPSSRLQEQVAQALLG